MTQEAGAPPMTQQPCQYSRTLEEVGDFCIIKDDWVSETQCNQCPARPHPPAPEPTQDSIEIREAIKIELLENEAMKLLTDEASRAATLAAYGKVEDALNAEGYYENSRWVYRGVLDSLRQSTTVGDLVEGVNGKMILKSEDHYLNPESKNFDPDATAHDPGMAGDEQQ